MVRPFIGMSPLIDDSTGQYYMIPECMKGIEAAGGIPVMFPLTDNRAEITSLSASCDGILFPGGHDVNPALYGEAPVKECGSPCDMRDAMEKILLEVALDMDKPVLGICRGMQMMNVLLGGTLYQDLPTMHPSLTEHNQKPPYSVPVHRVNVVPHSRLFNLLGKTELAVNSYHHQAVRTLAPRLTAMALSEDGIIEGFCLEQRKFVWGVQWHPETLYKDDASSLAMLTAFVNACVNDEQYL